MTSPVGVWLRRQPLGHDLDAVDDPAVHVTLARLDDDRWLSITAGGELHVWPQGSTGPDWNQWVPLKEVT